MYKYVHFTVLFMVFISTSLLSHAQVYKWRDENGTWRYSDIKPMKVKEVTLFKGKKNKQKPLVDEGVNHKPKTESEKEVGGDAQPHQLVVEKEDLEVKKRNCAGAKANLTIYSNGGRIRAANANGEMVFLSDAKIAEMKLKAQQDIKQYCG